MCFINEGKLSEFIDFNLSVRSFSDMRENAKRAPAFYPSFLPFSFLSSVVFFGRRYPLALSKLRAQRSPPPPRQYLSIHSPHSALVIARHSLSLFTYYSILSSLNLLISLTRSSFDRKSSQVIRRNT